MEWRNAFKNIFGKVKQIIKSSRWQEIGKYNSIFTSFGDNIYQSEIIRSCIRTLAEHSSKANAKSTNKQLQFILANKPNMYMNGKDFLYKVRTILELKNTAFIFISRNDKGKADSFYPIPYKYFEALEYQNGLFIKFHFASGKNTILPWEDLAVLRKDYFLSDIAGEDNSVILNTLESLNTVNEGLRNAIKSTANLRGILKSTKSMLDPKDIKKAKDDFVKDYLNTANDGGIASLDSTQEFTPIEMKPAIANYMHIKEFRENVYRYFGINDSIIMSDFTEAQIEAFYEARIEPFLVALSLELTNKVFTDKELAFENYIMFESNRMQYSSNKTKLQVSTQLFDRGILTTNQIMDIWNLPHVDGGDKRYIRKEYSEVSKLDSKDDSAEDDNKESEEIINE